jgi:hypothetical protein
MSIWPIVLKDAFVSQTQIPIEVNALCKLCQAIKRLRVNRGGLGRMWSSTGYPTFQSVKTLRIEAFKPR